MKKEEGITLVALIITIIVLIILAAVTLQTLVVDGVLNLAMQGSINYAQAQSNEISMLNEMNDKLYDVTKELGNDGEEPDPPGPTEPSVTPTPVDPNQPPTDQNKKIVNLQNDANITEWVPYYNDGTNIYIISWDSIPKDTVSDDIQSNKNSEGTEVTWDMNEASGAGQEVVESDFWRKYLYKTPLDHENSIWCEKLLNTSYWTKFYNNNYGVEAIGAPTLEMFEVAYDARYGTEEKVSYKWTFFEGEGNGYSVGMLGDGKLTHTEDRAFFLDDKNYLLASPDIATEYFFGDGPHYTRFIGVSRDGEPTECLGKGNLRPVIKLKSNIGIRDNGTNLELYDTTTGKTVN